MTYRKIDIIDQVLIQILISTLLETKSKYVHGRMFQDP
jgi:hypothetical protein